MLSRDEANIAKNKRRMMAEVQSPEPVTTGPIYTGVTNARNTAVALHLQGTGLFLTLHLAALSGIVPQVVHQLSYTQATMVGIACVLGLSLGLIWLKVAKLADEWVQFWNEQSEKLEKMDTTPAAIKVFRSVEFDLLDKRPWNFHRILVLLPWLSIAIWFVVLMFTFAKVWFRF